MVLVYLHAYFEYVHLERSCRLFDIHIGHISALPYSQLYELSIDVLSMKL